MGLGLFCSVREALPLTVTLPKAELAAATRAKLAEIVCGRPYEVAAQLISGYSLRAGLLGAYVTCQPHSEYQGNHVLAAAECEGRGNRWKCDERWLNVNFALDGYPKSVRIDDVPVNEATRIIEFLSTLPPYDHRRVTSDEVRAVWLLKLNEGSEFEAYLNGKLYTIQRQCSNDKCTYSVSGWALVDY
jgi:hypothetical protein